MLNLQQLLFIFYRQSEKLPGNIPDDRGVPLTQVRTGSESSRLGARLLSIVAAGGEVLARFEAK